MKCRKCGQAGHFTKDCPGAAPPQQPPPPAAPPAQPAPAPTQCPVADKPMPLSQMGPSGVKCRKCGGTGHYTKDCPGGAPAPSTPSPAAPTPAPAAPAAPPKAAAPPKEEPKKEEPKIEEAPRCPEVTKEVAKPPFSLLAAFSNHEEVMRHCAERLFASHTEAGRTSWPHCSCSLAFLTNMAFYGLVL